MVLAVIGVIGMFVQMVAVRPYPRSYLDPAWKKCLRLIPLALCVGGCLAYCVTCP